MYHAHTAHTVNQRKPFCLQVDLSDIFALARKLATEKCDSIPSWRVCVESYQKFYENLGEPLKYFPCCEEVSIYSEFPI